MITRKKHKIGARVLTLKANLHRQQRHRARRGKLRFDLYVRRKFDCQDRRNQRAYNNGNHNHAIHVYIRCEYVETRDHCFHQTNQKLIGVFKSCELHCDFRPVSVMKIRFSNLEVHLILRISDSNKKLYMDKPDITV